MDQIARALKKELDLTADQIKGDVDRPVAEVSTASLVALRAYQSGLAQLQQGAPKAAIPLLQEATTKDPSFAMAYAKLAEAQRAEALAKEAKAEGIVPEILLGRGELLHQRGKHAESAAAFEQANVKANLSGQKEVAVASRIALGELYLEQGRLGNAESLLRRTREEAAQSRLKPLEAAAALALGEALLAKSDAEGARRQALEAISIADKYSGKPLLYRAQALLGASLDKLGKLQQALEAYATAASALDWIRGSLRPEHVAAFLAQSEVRGFLRVALPRLEKAGRAPEALRG